MSKSKEQKRKELRNYYLNTAEELKNQGLIDDACYCYKQAEKYRKPRK